MATAEARLAVDDVDGGVEGGGERARSILALGNPRLRGSLSLSTRHAAADDAVSRRANPGLRARGRRRDHVPGIREHDSPPRPERGPLSSPPARVVAKEERAGVDELTLLVKWRMLRGTSYCAATTMRIMTVDLREVVFSVGKIGPTLSSGRLAASIDYERDRAASRRRD